MKPKIEYSIKLETTGSKYQKALGFVEEIAREKVRESRRHSDLCFILDEDRREVINFRKPSPKTNSRTIELTDSVNKNILDKIRGMLYSQTA